MSSTEVLRSRGLKFISLRLEASNSSAVSENYFTRFSLSTITTISLKLLIKAFQFESNNFNSLTFQAIVISSKIHTKIISQVPQVSKKKRKKLLDLLGEKQEFSPRILNGRKDNEEQFQVSHVRHEDRGSERVLQARERSSAAANVQQGG